MPTRLPVFILGGSDNKPGPVPNNLQGSQMLRGYKGAIKLPHGSCLAQALIERIRSTELFDDPILFGPAHVYEGLVDCQIVHVEGNLADTLTAVRDQVRQQSDLMQPIAFTSCDILPTSEEIKQLMATCYEPHRASFLGTDGDGRTQ